MLRDVISNDWFTLFLLLGLTLVTLSKFLFTHRFKDFLVVLANSKYLKIYSRNQKFIDGFDALLFINGVISISIFSYLSYNTIVNPSEFHLDNFIKLLFGFGSFFLIKILLERLIGSLFDIENLIDAYLFQKTTFKNYSGLVLLPINAVLIYALNMTTYLIYAVMALLILMNILGFMISFKNHQKIVINNLFYFILYLCTLEIGPYLILYKYINNFNA